MEEMIEMKFWGYKKDDDALLQLEEVSLECTITEMQDIIDFLNNAKKEHESVQGKTGMCHSHLRDFSSEWKKGAPDFIVVTSQND